MFYSKVIPIEQIFVLDPVNARGDLNERKNEILNRTHTRDNNTNIMELLTIFLKLNWMLALKNN